MDKNKLLLEEVLSLLYRRVSHNFSQFDIDIPEPQRLREEAGALERDEKTIEDFKEYVEQRLDDGR